MFETSRTIDYHEAMHGSDIVVDVERVAPEETVFYLAPQHPVSYHDYADEVELLLQDLARAVLGDRPEVVSLEWLVQVRGAHSRNRESLRRIH